MLIFLVKRLVFYYKLVFISLTRGVREKTTPFSLRRIILLLFLNVFGGVVFIINWTCLCADEIFFPKYRNLTVKKPFFILGVPRSGSTLLFLLLAQDEKTFTAFKFWEILFAPSIVQRKIFSFLKRIDRKTGGLLSAPVIRLDRRLFESSKSIHQVGLFLPEEDGIVLIWIFSTFFLFFAYPFLDQFRDYLKFDTRMPEKEKKRIMDFYLKMVQKHLYHHGPEKRFLSKNPTFSPWAGTLRQWFPDAVFLNTVRHPYQQIPSVISLMAYFTGKFGGDFLKTANYREMVLEITQTFYLNPVKRLKTKDLDRYESIRFDDFTGDPGKTIKDIYHRFDLDLSTEFDKVLGARSAAAAKYKSTHTYSLEQFDLTARDIFDKYESIFEAFGFIR